MGATLQASQRRAPICGVSSLVAPLVGLGVGFLVTLSMTGEAGLAAPFFAFLILCAFSVIGIIFAAVGLGRCERFPFLPWIGLVLNAAPILYGILFVR